MPFLRTLYKKSKFEFLWTTFAKKTYSQHPRTIAILRRTPIAEKETLRPAMFFGGGEPGIIHKNSYRCGFFNCKEKARHPSNPFSPLAFGSK